MNWIWAIGAPLVRAIMGMLFHVKIESAEHVPRSGPAILAPNHISVLDGPAVSAVVGTHRRRVTRNLIAGEVFSGLIGWILRQARQIPIRRGTGDTGALDDAAHIIREGGCVGIFPEGRVNDVTNGDVQRIRSGLTRIALPTGAPVIPIGIWGTAAIWPQDGLIKASLLKRPRVAIVFGEPLIPSPSESPTDFRERYRVALVTTVARARSIAGG